MLAPSPEEHEFESYSHLWPESKLNLCSQEERDGILSLPYSNTSQL